MTGSKHFKGLDAGADPILADVLKLGKPGERRADSPSTFVGRVGLQAGLGFAAENERLKAERDNGMVLLRLDPKKIGRTDFANRLELGLSTDDASFRQLKQSIQAHGQDTPVRVRPAGGENGFEYELVEGHRRHAVCLLLDQEIPNGFPILARLDVKASDSLDLVLKMYRENAEREDLSPFEYGRMFRSWLKANLFATQGELATAIRLSDAVVSRYLQIAELSPEILQAFGDPRQIAYRWMELLASALKSNRSAVQLAAEEIARREPRPAAEAVLRELVASAKTGGSPVSRGTREEAVKIKGKVAFRVAQRQGLVSLKLPKTIAPDLQQAVVDAVKAVAERLLTKRLGESK